VAHNLATLLSRMFGNWSDDASYTKLDRPVCAACPLCPFAFVILLFSQIARGLIQVSTLASCMCRTL
jgi:hypothetical protein